MGTNKNKHVEYQASYFNQHHDVFRQPIPADVVARTKHIVNNAGIHKGMRIFDVGTGMGVLIPHFIAHGVAEKDIVGCDLSSKMLAEARLRHPGITFWEGDFAQLPAELGHFDAIFFNACFGNLFDQDEAVRVATTRLNRHGRIVISHPMGNTFVLKLKEDDPNLVLYPLPDMPTLERWCQKYWLSLDDFCNDANLYCAILRKQ